MTRDFRPYLSLLKVSEGGGFSQEEAKTVAKSLGIEVRTGPSCYVGYFCVSVRTEDKRKLARLENALL